MEIEFKWLLKHFGKELFIFYTLYRSALTYAVSYYLLPTAVRSGMHWIVTLLRLPCSWCKLSLFSIAGYLRDQK